MTATATVTVTVQGRNDTPTALGNSYSTNDNTTILGRNLISDNTGAGLDSDPDSGDTLAIATIATPGSNQSITGTSNAVVTLDSGATLTVIYNTSTGRFDGGFQYDPSTSAALNGLEVGQIGG